MRLEASKPTARGHVHVHTLGARLGLLVLFSSIAVAGIAAASLLHLRDAFRSDTVAATQHIAVAAQTSLTSADPATRDAAARTLMAGLPSGSSFGAIDVRGNTTLRYPNGADQIGKPLLERDLLTEIISSKRGAVTLRSADGVKRLYAFSAVTDATGRPTAYVYVGVPESLVFAQAFGSLPRALYIALALIVLVLFVGLTFGDMLVLRRIRKMVEEMRHVAAGDTTDVRQIPGGLGELDQLSAIFDAMRNRMVEATVNTAEQVRSRTADLEYNKGMAEFEQARTEALLSSIGEAVIATDKAGRIIFINQEVTRALGWLPAEIVGKNEDTMLIFHDDKDVVLAVEKRPTQLALKTGQKAELAPLPKTYWLRRKDKSSYPVQVTVSPIISNGNLVGAIEVIRDVTAETELDRRKNEFISIASHQLRSPLAATKWLTDMLRKGDAGKLQDKQQEMADKLFEANERMVVLVNELLNVSRLDSGVSKPTPKETDAAELLRAVMTDTLPLLAGKQQKFVYEETHLPKIMVDPLMLREVLVNLISNASKYSPDGGNVTLGATPKDGMLQVSIKDDGIGIPKADQAQLFKKFFRAGNALKSTVQGTGLGLYFVKSTVELMGGTIWFESEENKGTTFFITLPQAKVQ